MHLTKETFPSLLGGIGLVMFMGGVIGGLLVLAYQGVQWLQHGQWPPLPLGALLGKIHGPAEAMAEAGDLSPIVLWALHQPASLMGILFGLLLGWPLILLSGSLVERQKDRQQRRRQ